MEEMEQLPDYSWQIGNAKAPRESVSKSIISNSVGLAKKHTAETKFTTFGLLFFGYRS